MNLILRAPWTVLWSLVGLPLVYLYGLALAARRRSLPPAGQQTHRFAIVIPAHDEESVIGRTVARLRELDYPAGSFDVHVVADHCTDRTAQAARAAGAILHERIDGPRTGKGGALGWGFARIIGTAARPAAGPAYDAVLVFDADTQVAPDFLRIIAMHLAAGRRAVQGQHRIANPQDGWYPALAWAMMLVHNRLQNQGRSNLGLSAANMGDAICVDAHLLQELGWGEGLTEDYDLRFNLLARGVRIVYEPAALAYGEAPQSWAIARRQRERWLAGTYRSSRGHRADILRLALRRGDPALWDALLQAVLPSYSTLTVLALLLGGLQCALSSAGWAPWSGGWLAAWGGALGGLGAYPFLGLALERAPGRAYLAVLLGPVFVVWRTWLALGARSRRGPATWVRTPRRSAR